MAISKVYESVAVALLTLVGTPMMAQQQVWRQQQADDYTRYELLDPASRSFRIFYDVAAVTPGVGLYFNSIRRGSEPTVHGVYDLHTGRHLSWEIVDGVNARMLGMENASELGQYIKVSLERVVPAGGEVRIRIDKTYRDTASYYGEGAAVVFSRSLGIKRNAVVLPPGYEVIGVNYPSQVTTEPDGRTKLSFMNPGPAAVPYAVKARPYRERLVTPARNEEQTDIGNPDRSTQPTAISSSTAARVDYRFSERAFQDREIVYFLLEPETHSFRLYHDYTETRPGVDRYLNVVRSGSEVADPSAVILDTGARLEVEILRGAEIAERGLEIGRPVTDEAEVVVVWFEPVPAGHSVRLRIEETYTDASRYLLVGDELIWDRSFGRSRNTVVLPTGWYLTESSIPAVVDETEAGAIRLHFVNDRPGNLDAFLKARRRGR